jgi:hypothetical protein
MKLSEATLTDILDAVEKDYVWREGDEHKVTRDPVNDVALLLDHGRAVEKERDEYRDACSDLMGKHRNADKDCHNCKHRACYGDVAPCVKCLEEHRDGQPVSLWEERDGECFTAHEAEVHALKSQRDTARAFIARLYAEGTLSEGQAAKVTGLDRVALRALAQEAQGS